MQIAYKNGLNFSVIACSARILFFRKEGKCRLLSFICLRPPAQLPLASGESSQASCKDIFRTTCQENPDPNAASGRKKGGIPSKNYEICLRLSEAQAQKLRQDAKACGLSKTAYLRRLIEGAELKTRPSQELRQLRTEIHHIGNNVNQLARKFNAGFGNKGDAQQVRYLMEQIYDLLYEIAKE